MRIKPVTEVELAALLRQAGIPVLRTSPVTDAEDASIEITDLVHITIPTFGGSPGVVRECQDGSFLFDEEQHTIEGLINQVRHHLEVSDEVALQAIEAAQKGLDPVEDGPSPC